MTNSVALIGHIIMQIGSYELLGFSESFSQICGIMASALINYYLARRVVFEKNMT